MTRIYLSWGMGVESNAILTRWLTDPKSRDFSLEELTVITAQTGDEHTDTKTYCETHILPLLRKNRIRLVQVARSGRFEEDGIEILDDSMHPRTLYIEELTNCPMNYSSPAPSHNSLASINAR